MTLQVDPNERLSAAQILASGVFKSVEVPAEDPNKLLSLKCRSDVLFHKVNKNMQIIVPRTKAMRIKSSISF